MISAIMFRRELTAPPKPRSSHRAVNGERREAFAAPGISLTEKKREGANIVTPKKGRPLNLELTGRQKRVFRARAGRETPAHKWPHLSARRGVLAVWPLALHITLQALRYDPEYPSLAPTKVDMPSTLTLSVFSRKWFFGLRARHLFSGGVDMLLAP